MVDHTTALGQKPFGEEEFEFVAGASPLGSVTLGAQGHWFEVKTSKIPDSGRGVFTHRGFRKGEVIMRTPIIIFPLSQLAPGALLRDYTGE